MRQLCTQRLLLLPAHPRFAERYVDFFRENAEHLRPWSPTPSAATYDIALQAAALRASAHGRAAGTHFEFVIVNRHDADGPIIGTVTLSNVIRGLFQASFLGYQLSAAAQGRGYMTEAVRAVITFAFDELSLHRIMANYMPANIRSARLLQRLGFTIEGTARDYLFLNNAWQDHVLTSLTNERFTWQ